MANLAALKALIVPAVISLILFLVSTYVAVPVWRRARDRYSQYIPLDTISSQTVSFRDRVSNRVAAMIAQPFWQRNNSHSMVASPGDDGLSDDGEELSSHVNPDTRRPGAENSRNGRPDNVRRLSRDLEEGFIDDSEDEDDRRRQRR